MIYLQSKGWGGHKKGVENRPETNGRETWGNNKNARDRLLPATGPPPTTNATASTAPPRRDEAGTATKKTAFQTNRRILRLDAKSW